MTPVLDASIIAGEGVGGKRSSPCDRDSPGRGRKIGLGGPVSRILSEVGPKPSLRMTISLGRRSPDASSDLPGSRDGPGRPVAGDVRLVRAGADDTAPLFGLAPDGVYRARAVARPAGELLPHRFTLTSTPAKGRWRFVFCGTVPTRVNERWALPTIAPYGVRTFLPAMSPSLVAEEPGDGAIIRPAKSTFMLRRSGSTRKPRLADFSMDSPRPSSRSGVPFSDRGRSS